MPENNKKSFIMYSNYRKFLSKLPDKDIADLIKAIFCFVEEEEVPELSPSAELCFIIISDQETWKNTKKCVNKEPSQDGSEA